MNELWKQERHFGHLRYARTDFDDLVKDKENELFGFIGNEWRKKIRNMITLNIGCGPIPLRFDSKKEIGLDPLIEQYMGMKYPKNHFRGIMLISGIAEDINLEDGYVDFVYCRKTIEYIKNWKFSLREMIRVLKKGGHLVLIYHNLQHDNTNLNLLEKVDMESHLKSIGFDILKHIVEDKIYVKIFARKK